MFKPIANLTKILLILLLPCSSTAFSEFSAKYYRIQIGNHSTLEVKFLDADFHTMSAHLQSPNGNNREILFDADRKEITLTDNSIPSTWHS
ncbi:MAG: hypothetical protein NTX25_03825, partial [Proteobacteria bacterium]|nr:hypothetical protein [Pseudomonadota bacterium]